MKNKPFFYCSRTLATYSKNNAKNGNLKQELIRNIQKRVMVEYGSFGRFYLASITKEIPIFPSLMLSIFNVVYSFFVFFTDSLLCGLVSWLGKVIILSNIFKIKRKRLNP